MVCNRVTSPLAQHIAEAIPAYVDASATPTRPQVGLGAGLGHENAPVISWEDGPFQWAYRVDVLAALGNRFGVDLETVNHFTVAITGCRATDPGANRHPGR